MSYCIICCCVNENKQKKTIGFDWVLTQVLNHIFIERIWTATRYFLSRIEFTWGIPPSTHFAWGIPPRTPNIMLSYFATGQLKIVPALRLGLEPLWSLLSLPAQRVADLDTLHSTLNPCCPLHLPLEGPLWDRCSVDSGAAHPSNELKLTETRVLLVHGSKANKEEKREVINYFIHDIKPTDQTQAQSTVHSTVPFPALIPKWDTPGVKLNGTGVVT